MTQPNPLHEDLLMTMGNRAPTIMVPTPAEQISTGTFLADPAHDERMLYMEDPDITYQRQEQERCRKLEETHPDEVPLAHLLPHGMPASIATENQLAIDYRAGELDAIFRAVPPPETEEEKAAKAAAPKPEAGHPNAKADALPYPDPATANFIDLHEFLTRKEMEAMLYAQRQADVEMRQPIEEDAPAETAWFDRANKMRALCARAIEKHVILSKKYPKPPEENKPRPTPANFLSLERYIQYRIQRYIIEKNLVTQERLAMEKENADAAQSILWEMRFKAEIALRNVCKDNRELQAISDEIYNVINWNAPPPRAPLDQLRREKEEAEKNATPEPPPQEEDPAIRAGYFAPREPPRPR
jgi:hypothetical protein